MSSINEIIKAFTPVYKEVQSRIKTNQTTPLDLRIVNLANILSQNQDAEGSNTFDDFKAVNTSLSASLTLLDLKTSLECSPEATGLIVTYLKLQQNFDKISATFPVMERIQAVSERVLKHVQLLTLQITGFVVPLEHSPIWYALATDDQFLNRQVRDLKEFHLDTDVAAAKIQDIEERTPALLNSYRDVQFNAPWMLGTLDLTLGKLRLLSGEELNSIASKLPPSAGNLFSDNQIRSINFNLFSGEILDKMIAGDETDEEISRRLSILSFDQIEVFLKKSSGCHFAKFSDSFYQMFPLSRLNKEQVKALFNDNYGMQKEKVIRHLHLVSPQEIAKGFHLLSGELARMLSDTQLTFLNYTNMTEAQINDLFESYHFKEKEELRRRIQLIPEMFVNDVTKTNSSIIKSLSSSQYRVLNTALLEQKTVRDLFPGFTIDTLYPGYTYTVKDRGVHGIRHEFNIERGSSSAKSSYSTKQLDDKLKENEAHCVNMANNFSLEQLRAMLPLMYSECQNLIAKKTESLSA